MCDRRLLDGYEKTTSCTGEVCPICTEKVDPEKPFVVLKCGHILCSPCAGKTASSGVDNPSNRKCPTCRNDDSLKSETNVYICRVNNADWTLDWHAVTANMVIFHPVDPFPFSGLDINKMDIDEIYRLRPNIPMKERPFGNLDPLMRLKVDTLKRTADILRDDVDKIVKKQKAASEDIAKFEKEVTTLNTRIAATRKNLDAYTDHTRFLMIRLDSVNKEIADVSISSKTTNNNGAEHDINN